MEIEVRPHRRHHGPRGRTLPRVRPGPFLHPAGVEPLDDQTDPPLIPDSGFPKPDEPAPGYLVQESADIRSPIPLTFRQGIPTAHASRALGADRCGRNP